MVPMRDSVFGTERGFNRQHARRPKVSPRKFFFARPAHMHRFARFFRQARCFNRHFAAVFPAKASARIWNDHAHPLNRNLESTCEAAPDSARLLRASPDGEL